MDIVFVKDGLGFLRPATARDADQLSLIRNGELVRATVKQPRNLQLHRKFMSLWDMVYRHQDRYKVWADFLCEVKLRLGHYTEHIGIDGVIHYIPKSISFEECDDVAFRDLYERSVDVALREFLPLWSRGDIEEAEAEILRYT